MYCNDFLKIASGIGADLSNHYSARKCYFEMCNQLRLPWKALVFILKKMLCSGGSFDKNNMPVLV